MIKRIEDFNLQKTRRDSEKIKILDHEFSFTISTFEELDDCWGRSNAMYGWIKIAKECGPDQHSSTLLHEVIHCILDLNDLKKCADDETTISVLASGILSFIKSNPEIVKKMMK
jgi:hypothetical protein